MGWMTKVQLLAVAGKEFFFLSSPLHSDLFWGQPNLAIQWLPGTFPMSKVAGV
jgi:hypothetical protein